MFTNWVDGTARPTMSSTRYATIQTAHISNSSTKQAEPAAQQTSLVGSASSQPPFAMKTISGRDHKEVLLPSQEGKQGVAQYALYVTF